MTTNLNSETDRVAYDPAPLDHSDRPSPLVFLRRLYGHARQRGRDYRRARGMSESSPFPDRCDHCGIAFETGVRYPTTTAEGKQGVLEIYTFCDEECKSAWGTTSA